jgi:hypothetical protein
VPFASLAAALTDATTGRARGATPEVGGTPEAVGTRATARDPMISNGGGQGSCNQKFR